MNYLKLGQWFGRRCSFKDIIISSLRCHLVQEYGAICAILVEGIMREVESTIMRALLFESIFNLDLWFRMRCL